MVVGCWSLGGTEGSPLSLDIPPFRLGSGSLGNNSEKFLVPGLL